MRAWIARDSEEFGGRVDLFTEDPTWKLGYWTGFHLTGFDQAEIDGIASAVDLQHSSKQQIKLTARPVGAAEGGQS